MALVYCTKTDVAVIDAKPLIVAAKAPFASSKAILSPSTFKPKSASVRLTLAAPASRLAETLSPTATIAVPDLLKPTFPLSFTKLLKVASNPVTAKATVFAAISSAKVYETNPTVSVVAVNAATSELYCTSTLSALIEAKPAMDAVRLPFDSSKATLSSAICKPKSAPVKLTFDVPAIRLAETSSPTTINVPAFSLKPRPPERVTNPDRSTLNPEPDTANSPFAIPRTLTVTPPTVTS